MADWNARWMEVVRTVMSWSSDRSTKCGCVIVNEDNHQVAVGYNGLPRDIKYTEERQERPEKYYWFEHAERNAIYNAARAGHKLDGCIAYISGPPCHDCARGLIQAGISRIKIPKYHNFLDKEKDERWRESCDRAMRMLKEAGVDFQILEDEWVEDGLKHKKTSQTSGIIPT